MFTQKRPHYWLILSHHGLNCLRSNIGCWVGQIIYKYQKTCVLLLTLHLHSMPALIESGVCGMRCCLESVLKEGRRYNTHIYIKQYLFLGSRSKNISVPCCGSCHRIQHPRRPSSLSCHWRELFLRATANVHRSIIIVVTSCSSGDTWSTHPVKPTKIFILPRISFTSHSIKWCPALLIICTIIYTR